MINLRVPDPIRGEYAASQTTRAAMQEKLFHRDPNIRQLGEFERQLLEIYPPRILKPRTYGWKGER